MTIICVVKLFDKRCQLSDKAPSQLKIFDHSKAIETGGQFPLKRFGIRELFGNYEASFLKKPSSLLAVANNFWRIYTCYCQFGCRFQLAKTTAFPASMREPVLKLK